MLVGLTDSPTPCVCVRCGHAMGHIALMVADAAQMFEAVPPALVMSGLRELLAWAQGCSYTGVVVWHGARYRAHPVRQVFRRPPGTAVFTLRELEAGMTLALAQTMVSLGDITIGFLLKF